MPSLAGRQISGWYLGAMTEEQLVRCRRCTYMYDPAEGDGRSCPICGATANDFLAPQERHQRFGRLDSVSHIVARLQRDPTVVDLAPDGRAWPEWPKARRERVTTLLAGFCVAEEAVAEHLNPFTGATSD